MILVFGSVFQWSTIFLLDEAFVSKDIWVIDYITQKKIKTYAGKLLSIFPKIFIEIN